MMTSAQVVVTSVTTTDNSPSQDYTRPDDQTTLLHVTPVFKPFIVHLIISIKNNKRLKEWISVHLYAIQEPTLNLVIMTPSYMSNLQKSRDPSHSREITWKQVYLQGNVH